MSLVSDISLEIQNKLSVFLGLRSKIKQAINDSGSFPVLQTEGQALSDKIESDENIVEDFLPKVLPYTKGQVADITQIPSLIKTAGTVNSLMDTDIKNSADYLKRVSSATGKNYDIPRVTPIINTAPLLFAAAGIMILLAGNLFRKRK